MPAADRGTFVGTPPANALDAAACDAVTDPFGSALCGLQWPTAINAANVIVVNRMNFCPLDTRVLLPPARARLEARGSCSEERKKTLRTERLAAVTRAL